MSDVDDRALTALRRCSNAGRWGPEDELGTLNHITPQVRRDAAALVLDGVTVSLGQDIDTVQSAANTRPAWHVMHLEKERDYATADSLHLQVHGLATTHLDALGHMFFQGVGYNGRRQDETVTNQGLTVNSIHAMREGIVTRGLLLDVAAAAGVDWLRPADVVTPALLERAEASAGVRVRAGDAVFVHVGLERRVAATGPEDPAMRAGLDLDSVVWLHEREVAVYSGDCIEAQPGPGGVVEMPLHQIGIASMGLVLLDCPSLSGLVDAVARFGRAEFLLTVAPLRVPHGTGSPVNPIAVF